MSNVFIPHDLVRDVLIRLPVKSLLRFKCVSRSWYLMIEDPDFTKTHIKPSELNESNLKVIAEGVINGVNKLFAVDFSFSGSFKEKNMEEIDYSSIMSNGGNKVTIAGSCNGLVCLVYSKRDAIIVLWNPRTRKHLLLPICSKHHRTMTIYDSCGHGFGYDEVTDDYKVVRLVIYRDENYHRNFSESFVYSLKSDEWRRSVDFAYGTDLFWQYDGVLANGALHWLFQDRSILAFNLATEGFKLLPPPPETSNYCPRLLVPLVGGCQNLIFVSNHGGSRKMWVMKNCEIEDSWTKFTSDVSTNRKLLMFITFPFDDKRIAIFDLEEQRLEPMKFPNTMEYRAIMCLF